jgi:hypothetical protein
MAGNVTPLDAQQRPHVVVIGNVMDGFRVIGPFDNATAMQEWAQSLTPAQGADEWIGLPLVSPEDWVSGGYRRR